MRVSPRRGTGGIPECMCWGDMWGCVGDLVRSRSPGKFLRLQKSEVDMKTIKLTQNREAIVDDGDYEFLSRFKWYAKVYGSGSNELWYAYRDFTNADRKILAENFPTLYINKSGCTPMHRVIAEAQKGQDVDHINHNGLDNRCDNLRKCTRSENSQNKRLRSDSKSGFKGVYEIKGRNLKKPFMAYISDPSSAAHKKRNLKLGYYLTAELAAKAYDDKAKEQFGKFAQLNFPQNDQE